jgi:hypothetical protein
MAHQVAVRRASRNVGLVWCPECHAPAEIDWRATTDSTDGPVEVAKIRCLHRHWFLMPLDDVTRM